MAYFMPYVIEKGKYGERAYDVFSRLLQDRIIYLSGPVTSDMASMITGELLYLAAEDDKKDIWLYINSPGGEVSAGMAIYDTMQYIQPDVTTVCMGMAASMGAFLLAGGAKGKRYALPNVEIMIHQPSGGISGQATDIQIVAENIIKTKQRMNEILAENTGKSVEEIASATERDHFMTAEEAKDFGLIDDVLMKCN